MITHVANAIHAGRLVPPSFVAQAVLYMHQTDVNACYEDIRSGLVDPLVKRLPPARLPDDKLNEYADLAVRMWYASLDGISRADTADEASTGKPELHL